MFPLRSRRSGRQTPRVDLTVAAAFTAAGFSFINVVITARLARRADLRQWQRAEGQPIVAHILVVSRETTLAWGQAAFARHTRLSMDNDKPRARSGVSLTGKNVSTGPPATMPGTSSALRLHS